jgi:CRISPR-associated endonuclease Csy4
MHYYRELTLMQSYELGGNLYFLWHKLYTQVHLSLVDLKQRNNGQQNIGITFPEYKYENFLNENNPESEHKKISSLGFKLRLLGTEQALQGLNLDHYLRRLQDYVHVTTIREIPEQRITGYACFQRQSVKSNVERLIRRYLKRNQMGKHEDRQTEEQLRAFYMVKKKSCDLPYINMNSLSSEQNFRLFIRKEVRSTVVMGQFCTYGLSQTVTVPEF